MISLKKVTHIDKNKFHSRYKRNGIVVAGSACYNKKGHKSTIPLRMKT